MNKPLNKLDELKSFIEYKFSTRAKKCRFLWINDNEALVDYQTGIIWARDPKNTGEYHYNTTIPKLELYNYDWKLPTEKILKHVHNFPKNIREKLFNGRNYWLCLTDECSQVVRNFDLGSNNYGFIVHTIRSKHILNTLIELVKNHQVKISSHNAPDNNIAPDLYAYFISADYSRSRLPKLSESDLTDRQNGGLWELYGVPENDLHNLKVRARNPELDIKNQMITIDFGTSSSVVAYEDDKGRENLLRIGVADFFQAPKAQDFENPTVLEFINFPEFLKAWQSVAHLPNVNWNDVRCSHEARQNLRNNDSQPQIVGSILPKLKQWALRDNLDSVHFCDQVHLQQDYKLAPLQELNPERGKKMTVDSQYQFDPIELYAWFLGLNINWRKRGIFLRYGMTFPVGYDRDVKDKILASFRRGLLRSLPESLMSSERINEFSVKEIASEPAAFAAAAMIALNIEPSEQGVAYGVFDFGGGTADFDFGKYRLPDDDEADEYEEVFEHFGASGDKFLGGENLLENLAYLTFVENLEQLRSQKIIFTQPLDSKPLLGAEMLISSSQAAYTNTQMLIAKLRRYWEAGEESDTGTLPIALLDRDGNKQSLDLLVPYDKLAHYLEDRISKGIGNFLTAMKTAFAENVPNTVHILLAGNACRSDWVGQFFFDEENNEIQTFQQQAKAIFGNSVPKFEIHPPLSNESGEDDQSQLDTAIPTTKTGVALGALRLRAGNGVKVINHNITASSGNAPFKFYVGRFVRKVFQPSILRGSTYGVWTKLGVVSEGVFNLGYTSAERATSGELRQGDSEVGFKPLDFVVSGEHKHYVFAQVISPTEIELCTSTVDDANYVAQHHSDNQRTLRLD